jgi:hypothetical protein
MRGRSSVVAVRSTLGRSFAELPTDAEAAPVGVEANAEPPPARFQIGYRFAEALSLVAAIGRQRIINSRRPALLFERPEDGFRQRREPAVLSDQQLPDWGQEFREF